MSLHEWLIAREGVWLFYVLLTSIALEAATFIILIAEYKYDERKDLEKKQRRTKTSKKTTTSATGQNTVEETTEVIEPIETKDGTHA